MPPCSSTAIGKAQPRPRNSAAMSADPDGAGGHDPADRQIDRVVAGQHGVSGAGSGATVDPHRGAPRLHRPAVAGRPGEAGPGWRRDVGWLVAGPAADDGGGHALDPYVRAEPLGETAHERGRERDGRSRRLQDEVRVDGAHHAAEDRGGLAHRRSLRSHADQLMSTVEPWTFRAPELFSTAPVCPERDNCCVALISTCRPEILTPPWALSSRSPSVVTVTGPAPLTVILFPVVSMVIEFLPLLSTIWIRSAPSVSSSRTT